jgi:chromosome partitioning protein
VTTVISIGNEKGGVGKTTLSINLGAFLAEQGLRVMILDADAQAHATIGLGLKPVPGGFYDLIARDAEYDEVLKVIPAEKYAADPQRSQGLLAIMPGNLETVHIANHINETGDLFKIHERLQELDGNFDVVIIDHSPTPSLLHTSLYYATDILFAPCEPEFFSMASLANTLQRCISFGEKRSKAGYGGIAVGGIIPTMYVPSTVEHSENLKAIIEKYGNDYLITTPLPMRTAWREAAMQRQSIFRYAPDSMAAKEARSLMQKLMEAVSV